MPDQFSPFIITTGTGNFMKPENGNYWLMVLVESLLTCRAHPAIKKAQVQFVECPAEL